MTEKRSTKISRIINPAVQLWLRSQLKGVEELHFQIEAGDRQILSGSIPRVSLSAQKANYQGLHISAAQVVAENIKINLGQILKGKPLRILEPIPLSGQLQLQETDLQASLQSDLLIGAFRDLLLMLVESHPPTLQNTQLSWEKLIFNSQSFKLIGTITPPQHQPEPISICSHLELIGDRQLQFSQLDLQLPATLNVETPSELIIDLGSEVSISELNLSPGLLTCQGRVNVLP